MYQSNNTSHNRVYLDLLSFPTQSPLTKHHLAESDAISREISKRQYNIVLQNHKPMIDLGESNTNSVCEANKAISLTVLYSY